MKYHYHAFVKVLIFITNALCTPIAQKKKKKKKVKEKSTWDIGIFFFNIYILFEMTKFNQDKVH